MTFISLIKQYRLEILLTLFFILISNFLSLAIPWGIKLIIDDVLVNRDLNMLNKIAVGLVLILIFQSGFDFLRKYYSNNLGEQIVCGLREKIYWHVHNLQIKSIKKITPPLHIGKYWQS